MSNNENIPSFEVSESLQTGVENHPSFEVDGETKQPEISVGVQVGIENHKELKGRDLPDQHPISAITGLQEALDSKAEDGDFVTKDELDKKQDVILDLAEIRDGAGKGATAVQPSSLGAYATKQELSGKQDKGDYALKSDIPKKVSALENDKGYLTEHQDISGLATKQELAGKQDFISDLPAIRSGSVLGSTAVQPATLNEYATKQALTDGLATKQPVGDYATKQELDGKQDVIQDLATIRKGAEKGATAVQPNDIPVKDVQLNGTSVVADNVANIPILSATTLGVGKISSAFGTGTQSVQGYISLVKATDAEIVAKTQNYKPIVPSSLDKAVMEGLGNNSLTWTDAYKSSARNTIGAGQQRTTVVDSTTPTITLDNALANTDYQYGTITSLTISAVENSYLETNFYFTAGPEITVDLPDTLKIIGTPSFEANKQYAMSICNNTLIVGTIS